MGLMVNNFIAKKSVFRVFGMPALVQVALMLMIIMIVTCTTADGEQTNKNKITDLFDKEVEDRQGLEKFLENSRKESEQNIVGKKGLQALGVSENELENKTSELNSINANNLESKGQQERAKEENNYYDTLEVDYLDPKIINHKKDIDLIVDASEKLMSRLIDGLKDLDIDCKQAKGNVEIEPEYYLDIKKEPLKDTIYNQHICEELRNRYNCNDTLTLNCKTQGIKWGEWQDKKIDVDGGELIKFSAQRHMFDIHHVVAKCFEYKLFSPDSKKLKGFIGCDYNPNTIPSMREFLAEKHKATIDNIGTEMSFSWYGGIFSIDGWMYDGRALGSKDYAWAHYIINYKYREGNPACFEWHEDWNEACKLQ